MKDFTPKLLEILKEKGYEVIILMEYPDKTTMMPLERTIDTFELNLLNYKQLEIYDLELEVIAYRLGKAESKSFALSEEFMPD